jgi:hypothetical protein
MLSEIIIHLQEILDAKVAPWDLLIFLTEIITKGLIQEIS